MLNDISPNRPSLKKQMSARESSPEFGKRKLNNMSTIMPSSKANLQSVFEQNRKPLGSESVLMKDTKLKNFSIMNVSQNPYCLTNSIKSKSYFSSSCNLKTNLL